MSKPSRHNAILRIVEQASPANQDELRKAHAQVERLQRQLRREVQKVHKQYRRDLVLVRDERLPERQ